MVGVFEQLVVPGEEHGDPFGSGAEVWEALVTAPEWERSGPPGPAAELPHPSTHLGDGESGPLGPAAELACPGTLLGDGESGPLGPAAELAHPGTLVGDDEALKASAHCPTDALAAIPRDLQPEVLACATIRVPTTKVLWMIQLSSRPWAWPARLRFPLVDLPKHVPALDVTIEILRFGFPVYHLNPRIQKALNAYISRRSRSNYPIAVSSDLRAKAITEKHLDVSVDPLFTAAHLPVGPHATMAQDQFDRHMILVWSSLADGAGAKFVHTFNPTVLDRFVFDHAEALDAHSPLLSALAAYVVATREPGSPIHVSGLTVTGHTDSEGTDDYNAALGRRRADNVVVELTKSLETLQPGLSKALAIHPDTQGERHPVSSSDPARNRRVEITLQSVAAPPDLDLADTLSRLCDALKRHPPPDPSQARRLTCVVCRFADFSDDEFLTGQQVVEAANPWLTPRPLPTFPRLRDSLVRPDLFGPGVTDLQAISHLEALDRMVLDGINTIKQKFDYFVGAAATLTDPTMMMTGPAPATFNLLVRWYNQRVNTTTGTHSIYQCYR